MLQITKPDLVRKPKIAVTQTQSNFFPKQTNIRVVKFPTAADIIPVKPENMKSQKNILKSEVIALRTSPGGIQAAGYGTSYGKPFMKINISDLYKDPVSKPQRQTGPDVYSMNTLQDDHQLKKNRFYANISSENIEDEFGDQEKVKKNGTVSTMESSTQLTKLKSSSNFSMSSIHNTYCFNEAFDRSKAIGYRDNSTPLSDILKQRQFKTKDSGVRPMSNKNSKAVIKFNEAMEKAKIYNDQMIKQYQFDRENEEEEHDFVELCEILQTNLKE